MNHQRRERVTPHWQRLSAVTLRQAATWVGAWLALSCSGQPSQGAAQAPSPEPVDAQLVAAQPGAWFDAQGNLTVVGPGRRLRLVLSAPISACSAAFARPGSREQIAEHASLPFHILSDLCRESHPTILLSEESETASPSELERSYHEVARCAASDLGLSEGWPPGLVGDADPCPLALGLGWRLPSTRELSGLTLDDRKAIAGALFDPEDRGAFGGLLLYARGEGAAISLVTLSPNAAEQAPALDPSKPDQPFFGATLRCTRDNAAAPRAPLPILPRAAGCLREQRQQQSRLAAAVVPSSPELQKLKAWLETAERTPGVPRSEGQLRELAHLLSAPALETLAREARDERNLTERYSELAEGLDDPAASEAERRRRRSEFDNVRKRLGGQIARGAERAGGGRSELGAVLGRLRNLLAQSRLAKSPKKARDLDYGAVLSLVDRLDGKAKP